MRRSYYSLIRLMEKYYWFWFALLTAGTAFLCFRCLGIGTIDSWDEARHGISAYEMMQSGNYLVNTFQGAPDYWNVKPPLSFLAVAAGFSLFGYTAVGLRFFSALSYLLVSVCTGLFARRYGKPASLFAMAFLAANYFPFKAHLVRAGDADGLYLLFFTLAMLAMLELREHPRFIYLCGLFFSLAFLTKSFHAGMIAAVGGLFLLLTGELKRLSPAGGPVFSHPRCSQSFCGLCCAGSTTASPFSGTCTQRTLPDGPPPEEQRDMVFPSASTSRPSSGILTISTDF